MAESRKKLYPDSKVELTPFVARHYDRLLDLLSGGTYRRFIAKAISDLALLPDDSVLDLGCGTGRNAALMLEHLGPGGRITGLDLSPEMKEQFVKRFAGEPRASFHQQRIDVPFNLERKFDLAFISFVLHGFPQEVRKIILENVIRHLKPGGRLAILDYAEFNLRDKPLIFRWVFKKFECAYARDFIEFDWKKILKEVGFQIEAEKFYFRNYLRLLKTRLKGL
ncbi:MAG: class I SAM-dependent methyltransferase [Candidatus Saccharicenans sp.]|uniref:class I SAM-dependent methyltransferase n=1 Tax=Candidatus Saccharicenans sp. TaxID=2819258 RepID=UPI00404AE335